MSSTVGLGELFHSIHRTDGCTSNSDNDNEGDCHKLQLAHLLDAIELQVEHDWEDKGQHAITQRTQQRHHLSKVRKEQGDGCNQDHGECTGHSTDEELDLLVQPTRIQLESSFDLEVECGEEKRNGQQDMEGDNDGRDGTGGASRQILVDGRLDNVTIHGISRDRAHQIQDGDRQDTPKNDLVPGTLVLHALFDMRKDDITAIREGKRGKGKWQMASNGDIMVNSLNNTTCLGHQSNILGVQDSCDHDNYDNHYSREGTEDAEKGDLTHRLCEDDWNGHNGGEDDDPLLQGDVASNGRGQVMDIGSSQNQIQNWTSKGDRVVEKGDKDPSGQSKRGMRNIRVFSQTSAAKAPSK